MNWSTLREQGRIVRPTTRHHCKLGYITWNVTRSYGQVSGKTRSFEKSKEDSVPATSTGVDAF